MVVGGRASQADAGDDRHRGMVASAPERRLPDTSQERPSCLIGVRVDV